MCCCGVSASALHCQAALLTVMVLKETLTSKRDPTFEILSFVRSNCNLIYHFKVMGAELESTGNCSIVK
jgi:hypothetical protein